MPPSPSVSRSLVAVVVAVLTVVFGAGLAACADEPVIEAEREPRTEVAGNYAILAHRVAALAADSEALGFKLPDSSGGRGNVVLDAAPFRRMPLRAIRKELQERLRPLHWGRHQQILVSYWETNVLCAPSVQLWIAPLGQGPPVVEGLFQQTLVGREGIFRGCTRASLPEVVRARYRAALAQGHHGTMDWLAREPERRASPDRLWPEARTAIVCGLNYGPEEDPLPELRLKERGYVSVYARHRDYHDVLKGRLKELAGWIASRFAVEVKVFVDTAPILEKPLAQQAGLGWQGKHTNLVSREFGSWVFLGEVLTRLAKTIDGRAGGDPETSWTAKLLAGGPALTAKKLGEEGVEAALAVSHQTDKEVTAEAADLVYHLLVALRSRGVSLDDLARELERREGKSGVEEKASR